MLLMPAIASVHAGVPNSGIQTGEVKKAVPKRAFLNAINKYQSMEGATADQHIDTEPEDNAEEADDGDAGDEEVDIEDSDELTNEDTEVEQADEWDD